MIDTISWGELAAEAADRLGGSRRRLADAERAGRLIVMRACGATTDDWPIVSTQPATERGVAAIDAMTARRLAGEPLQYVLGEWGFRYLDLYVDHRVLIPRPETETVAEHALAEMERLAPGGAEITVADLGTGSGAIGLALAGEHKRAEVWLTDVSADALAVARANLAGAGLDGARVRVAGGSWFDALPRELAGHLGVIVANPPYVSERETLPAEVMEWEPRRALVAGPRGTEAVEHLIAEAPPWLVARGALVLEMAPDQTEPMAELARRRFAEVSIEADLAGRARTVVARHPHPER